VVPLQLNQPLLIYFFKDPVTQIISLQLLTHFSFYTCNTSRGTNILHTA